ncbi:BON domain-containing protein [Rugamonas sp. CCM 8940]|uniref:BON domain-containing protein n=1 Tax=Rugamonas sp. CCM 8940 TaxID=2765359 RepID=UPI0018F5844C|nr:BON domain-containing protein [Rugamonas sp. CCM 8940]MBJ7311510.1 BON domain-containing protein [Rugamonas sp. CCM 8940]
MNTDRQLQRAVVAQLDWEPSINACQIGVEVKDGIVTLAGHVANFGEKWAAEQLVRRIPGVQALVVELEVNLPEESRRGDAEIARAAENALEWLSALPLTRVQVMVENGWVSLSGAVAWQYQRQAAKRAVRTLSGVRGVSDSIAIRPAVSLTALRQDIVDALLRNDKQGARRIVVQVDGAQVTLSGSVASWDDRELAKQSAWGTPGVCSVIDQMQMQY